MSGSHDEYIEIERHMAPVVEFLNGAMSNSDVGPGRLRQPENGAAL